MMISLPLTLSGLIKSCTEHLLAKGHDGWLHLSMRDLINVFGEHGIDAVTPFKGDVIHTESPFETK